MAPPRIYALVSCFNEAQFIEESIRSYLDAIDEVIVIDGAYRGFPSTNDLSNDGTIDIVCHLIEQYPNKVSLYFEPRLTELAKRNLLLHLVPQGDWAFIVDGDEVCKGDVDYGMRRIRETDGDVGSVNLRQVHPDGSSDVAEYRRLIKRQKGVHYEGTHYGLTYEDGSQPHTGGHKVLHVTDFEIQHLSELRIPERNTPRLKYRELMDARNWIE